MRVLLLGTGSADGWPNPFCACPSCAAARDAGVVRGQTAALVDDALLLDCGPEAPRAAARAGRSLRGVRGILLTHAHPDHLGPAAALWRDWAHADGPLTVAGPPAAVAAWRDWIRPGSEVDLRPLAPGDRFGIDGARGGYDIRVLAAAHEPRGGDAMAAGTVLFDVTGPAGRRLLYAPDTGPLPPGTLDAVAAAGFDLVLLDETFGAVTDHGTGHLDFVTFPRTLAGLRRVGAVVERTDVVALHLGHGNPPPQALARRLRAWGARAVPDLTELSTDAGGAPAGPGDRPAGGRARRTLLLGGARSGKSAEAEALLAACPDVVYVATARADDADPEWAQRLAWHRARRPAAWTTAETLDVASILGAAPTGQAILVDCLTLWLTGQLDAAGAWPDGSGSPAGPAALAGVEAAITGLADAVRWTEARVVLVSNEVGSGVVPVHASGRLFRDLLGRLNAAVAAACDEVALLVAGIALPVTGTDAGRTA